MTTLRYGGNTSCVEIEGPDGIPIVLDSGTGVHALGEHLVATGARASRGHLLITHTHLDHIQGFPFFSPLFQPGSRWQVYGPGTQAQPIERALAELMGYTYFPVGLDQLQASVDYCTLTEGSFELDGVRVTTRYLNHPALTLGYRLEVGGVTVVYAVDHEPHTPHQTPPSLWGPSPDLQPPAADRFLHPEDGQHVEFLADADLVIHDAMYTAAEYPSRVTWGHSAAEQAVDYAIAAGAQRLALFHHEPNRDDAAVAAVVERCRERTRALGSPLEIIGAAEGDEITLGPTADARPPRPAAGHVAYLAAATDGPHATIVIVEPDPQRRNEIIDTLQPEGLAIRSATDTEQGLALARETRPAVMIVSATLPGTTGLDLCRSLRHEIDPLVRDTAVILLADESGPAPTAAAFAAGATDYLSRPYKSTHLRARVMSWVLRAEANRG